VPALFRNRFSPHQLGVADVLATLILTDETPVSITLIGVTPIDLELGLDLSPEVAIAADRAVECLAVELRRLGFPLEPRSAVLAAMV
jgi:hydrogenase maturation protease